jgi:hypothetical protein
MQRRLHQSVGFSADLSSAVYALLRSLWSSYPNAMNVGPLLFSTNLQATLSPRHRGHLLLPQTATSNFEQQLPPPVAAAAEVTLNWTA